MRQPTIAMLAPVAALLAPGFLSGAFGLEQGIGRHIVRQIPQETRDSSTHDLAGWSPKPTTVPDSLRQAQRALGLLRVRKRASSNTWENDKTCGWYASVSSSAMTCDENETCATNTDNAVACVSGTYSPFFTACFDFAAFQAGACSRIGAKTGCCQESSLGACGTYLWTGSAIRSQYRCLSQSTIITMNDLPQFVIDEATRTTSTTQSSSPPTSTSAARLPSSTGQLSGGSGENNSNSTTGIIVGAVLGGLALLVSLVAMILCCWCWKKRRSTKDGRAYIITHPGRCKQDHLDAANCSCSHVS